MWVMIVVHGLWFWNPSMFRRLLTVKHFWQHSGLSAFWTDKPTIQACNKIWRGWFTSTDGPKEKEPSQYRVNPPLLSAAWYFANKGQCSRWDILDLGCLPGRTRDSLFGVNHDGCQSLVPVLLMYLPSVGFKDYKKRSYISWTNSSYSACLTYSLWTDLGDRSHILIKNQRMNFL